MLSRSSDFVWSYLYFSSGKPKATLDYWFPAHYTYIQEKLEQSCAPSKKVIGYLLYDNLYPTDLEHGTKLNVFPSIQPAGKNIFY